MDGADVEEPMSGRLENKVALLFGAGQVDCDHDIWGNGRATAVAYAREGARVVAVDLDLDKAEETRSYVVKEGNDCVTMAANVMSGSDVEAVVEQTMEMYGGKVWMVIHLIMLLIGKEMIGLLIVIIKLLILMHVLLFLLHNVLH